MVQVLLLIDDTDQCLAFGVRIAVASCWLVYPDELSRNNNNILLLITRLIIVYSGQVWLIIVNNQCSVPLVTSTKDEQWPTVPKNSGSCIMYDSNKQMLIGDVTNTHIPLNMVNADRVRCITGRRTQLNTCGQIRCPPGEYDTKLWNCHGRTTSAQMICTVNHVISVKHHAWNIYLTAYVCNVVRNARYIHVCSPRHIHTHIIYTWINITSRGIQTW